MVSSFYSPRCNLAGSHLIWSSSSDVTRPGRHLPTTHNSWPAQWPRAASKDLAQTSYFMATNRLEPKYFDIASTFLSHQQR